LAYKPEELNMAGEINSSDTTRPLRTDAEQMLERWRLQEENERFPKYTQTGWYLEGFGAEAPPIPRTLIAKQGAFILENFDSFDLDAMEDGDPKETQLEVELGKIRLAHGSNQ
jgi:hypothetical protein